MSNFNSAYNITASYAQRPPIYMPVSTSASFSSIPTRSDLKFNLDLYNPHEYSPAASFDYPSPSSSVIIHHHPVHSPPPPPPAPSQAISRLRQINDELCYTLAQCDLDSQRRVPVPHHHIHHYPISPGPSRSPSPRAISSSSSSLESEPIPKRRNARMTYKAHIPRRPNPLNEVDQLLLTTSDVYERDDPMTVDIYPTRDQGFIRRIRNRPDNQQPWFPDSPPLRRNSFSESSTYRTPRGPDYDNRPITPNSRLANRKGLLEKKNKTERILSLLVRPRSSSVKSRRRPEVASINLLRQSTDPFSSTAPVWRPSGSIKDPKFIGSNEPPRRQRPTSEPVWNPGGTLARKKEVRAFDPMSKTIPQKHEPVWHPPPKNPMRKSVKYFEPSIKPELIVPVQQPAPLTRKKVVIPNANPMLKTRVAKAESKVKSAWTEPTTTVVKPKPPIVPRPTKTTTVPPKPAPIRKPVSAPPVKKPVPPAVPVKTDTGRSSLNDVPSKPMFESTPRTQSPLYEGGDLFDTDTQISTPSKTRKSTQMRFPFE